MFQGVEIADERVAAVTPTAVFAPFFSAADGDASPDGSGGGVNRESAVAEATGIGSASSIFRGGSVRVPVADLRPAAVLTPRWPTRSRPDDPGPHRYHCRAHKLAPAQEATIHALAGTRSLRSLAAEFGVSHETVRAVLRARDARPATAAA